MRFLKRLKSGNFWISMISAVVLILQAVFNVEIKTEYLNQIILGILGILVMSGIVSESPNDEISIKPSDITNALDKIGDKIGNFLSPENLLKLNNGQNNLVQNNGLNGINNSVKNGVQNIENNKTENITQNNTVNNENFVKNTEKSVIEDIFANKLGNFNAENYVEGLNLKNNSNIDCVDNIAKTATNESACGCVNMTNDNLAQNLKQDIQNENNDVL